MSVTTNLLSSEEILSSTCKLMGKCLLHIYNAKDKKVTPMITFEFFKFIYNFFIMFWLFFFAICVIWRSRRVSYQHGEKAPHINQTFWREC